MSNTLTLANSARRAAQAPTYEQAVASFAAILLRGLKSIRSEHSGRKAFARRLGLPVQSVINIERGHRKLQAAELFVLAYAMNESPEWLVKELLRRFETEIDRWLKESGY